MIFIFILLLFICTAHQSSSFSWPPSQRFSGPFIRSSGKGRKQGRGSNHVICRVSSDCDNLVESIEDNANIIHQSSTTRIDQVISTFPKEKKLNSSFHLLSLPILSSSYDETPKEIKDIWKWKDTVLGDGRDYFVPRPRALKALGEMMVGTSWRGENNDDGSKSFSFIEFEVEECVILSNCARMDVIIYLEATVRSVPNENDAENKLAINKSFNTLSHDYNSSKDEDRYMTVAKEAASYLVAKCLVEQVEYYKDQKAQKGGTAVLWEGISSFLDLPGVVMNTDAESDAKLSCDDESISLVASKLDQITNPSNITHHLSLVAAGIAPRPSRPGREVIFRPFSSRDAHIMLQLKRTTEVVVSRKSSKLKILLDSALMAGKSARDPNQIPILNELKSYGDGDGGRYSVSVAPPELRNNAVEDVIALAIAPAVMRCVERLNAMESSDQIKKLRDRAETLAQTILIDMKTKQNDNDNENVGKLDSSMTRKLNKILHAPMMKLRQEGSQNVDIEELLIEIEFELRKKG